MSRTQSLVLLLAVLLTAPLNLLAASDKPNVIVVLIDDMGWADVSSFGGKRVETEHIDRLASQGLRFNQFYVNSPICSPSRVALSTGQYPQRWRITSYLNNRQSNDQRGMAQWLDPSAPMLARNLQQAGYRTGHFGKWHMGGQRDVDDAPPITEYGFDKSLTNFEGMGAKLLPLVMQPGWDKPRRIWEGAVNLGEPVTWTPRWEITGGFAKAAMQFIDAAAEADEPFYVNVWPDDVHSPHAPHPDQWSPKKRVRYDAVLKAMDEQLGVLFDHVRSHPKLRDNTLIVFCSDNGPEPGAGTAQPLRGSKGWLYEGGVRSPLIVWAPGLMKEEMIGEVNNESVFSAIDVNRSLYEICGAEVPAGVDLDGEEVSQTMLGYSTEGRQGPIFWRRPPDRHGNDAGGKCDNPDIAVRQGRWKYYENYGGKDQQLYDLFGNQSEESDVASAHPQVVDRLHQAVQQWNSELPQDAGNPQVKSETTQTRPSAKAAG